MNHLFVHVIAIKIAVCILRMVPGPGSKYPFYALRILKIVFLRSGIYRQLKKLFAHRLHPESARGKNVFLGHSSRTRPSDLHVGTAFKL